MASNDRFNFWISGGGLDLGFNTYITQQQIYERATADFRKDQVDYSSEVGDQSLVGWWTRSQLSFHEGAGLKYVEVNTSDGDPNDNRFWTSSNVDPWTAGEVRAVGSAGIRMDSVPGVSSISACPTFDYVTLSRGDVNTYVADGNSPIQRGYTYTGEAIMALASSGTDTYAITPSAIEKLGPQAEKQYVIDPLIQSTNLTSQVTAVAGATDVAVTAGTDGAAGSISWTSATAGDGIQIDIPAGSLPIRHNLCTNPSFESGLTGWSLTTSDAAVLTLSATGAALNSTQAANVKFDYTTIDDCKSLSGWTGSPNAPGLSSGGGVFENSGTTSGTLTRTWGTAVPVSGSHYIVITGTSIAATTLSFKVNGSTVTPYSIINGSAWIAVLGVSAAITSLSVTASGSAPFIRIARVGLASKPQPTASIVHDVVPVTESHPLTASWYSQVTNSASLASLTAKIDWLDASGSVLSTSSSAVPFTSATSPSRVSITATAPSGAVSAEVSEVGTWTSLTSAPPTFTMDCILIEQSGSVNAYFDGSSALAGYGTSWDGTVNASSSTATPSSGAQTLLLRLGTPSGSAFEVQTQDGASWDTVGLSSDNTFTRGYLVSVLGSASVRLVAPAGTTGASSINYLSLTTSVAEPGRADADQSTSTNPDGPTYSGWPDFWTWDGTANDSTATRIVSPTNFHTAWAPPADASWANAWFVKGRLIAVDSQGRWFSLSPTSRGRASVDSDMFWSSGYATGWSVSEYVNGIYLARENTVYLLTIDTSDTTDPTLTAPTAVAQLPLFENVNALCAYLGRLAIAGSRGVRVAQIQTDGSLVLGPLTITGEAWSLVGDGDFVYALASDSIGRATGLFQISSVYSVDTLQPAYVLAQEAPVDSTSVLVLDSNNVAFTANGSLYSMRLSTAASGTFVTGAHRLGTIEPKAFCSVEVKTSGTTGSIDVSVIVPGGDEFAVGTVTAGQSGNFDLTEVDGIPSPSEYISLKFVISDSDSDIKLLGYSLKALPVPKRQRQIRVPLMLMDDERSSRGIASGTPHSAWARLQALESLEQSAAVVTFRDDETGETGKAYIDQIDVQRKAPANAARTGFGGVLSVTLRKID